MNHLHCTTKEWSEKLQLIPASLFNGKKALVTYPLTDPESQFTFILDKISDFLALLCKDLEATILQYLNTEHDMALSKISEPETVAPYENLDQIFQISTTYSTPCLYVATLIHLTSTSFAMHSNNCVTFTSQTKPKANFGAFLGINTLDSTYLI